MVELNKNTMTKKIVWRLKEQPSSESLRELVKDNILTKEEAREILFSQQEETERDAESLKAEIKFLRELVEKLSSNRSQTIEIIREVERPWSISPWYNPYKIWCSDRTVPYTNSASAGTSGSGSGGNGIMQNCSFSDIKTF